MMHRQELENLLEWVGRLGALSPVEVGLEAEEFDEFDGMENKEEEEEERREAREQANCANEADLEHGRSANIGQVYQVANYTSRGEAGALETELEVRRKGVKLGSVNVILEVLPEAEISIIGVNHLEELGVAREEVRSCLDSVRGELVVGQAELEVEKVELEVGKAGQVDRREVARMGGGGLLVRYTFYLGTFWAESRVLSNIMFFFFQDLVSCQVSRPTAAAAESPDQLVGCCSSPLE